MATTERREALTIRFPIGVLDVVKEVKGEASLNDFIVRAVEKEARWLRAMQAHENIVRLREQVKARTGPHPDATQMIRDLREGRGRRD